MFDVANIVEEGAHCGSCNWPASHQYVLARKQKEAEQLYKKGEAGLCGDCMCGMLTEGSDSGKYDYEITHVKRKPAKN